MPFPPIRHCIICDDLRIEQGNKAMILGFYGIAPDVEILVGEPEKPIQRIMFMFLAGNGAGEFKIQPKILYENSNVLKEGREIDFKLKTAPTKTVSIVFGFGNLIFNREGQYTIQLIVDGQVHYETTFQVSHAKPEKPADL